MQVSSESPEESWHVTDSCKTLFVNMVFLCSRGDHRYLPSAYGYLTSFIPTLS